MKAIVVHQPWATLIALGVKQWETRGNPPNGSMRPDGVRGLPGLPIEPGERIAIVAGKATPPKGLDLRGWQVMRSRLHRRFELWGPLGHESMGPLGAVTRPVHFLPLGAVVCTVEVPAVLPMTTSADIGDPECIVIHDGPYDPPHGYRPGDYETLDWCIPSWEAEQPPPDPNVVHIGAPEIPDGAHLIRDITDQIPYGHWEPGGWAWRLADVEPTEPIPVKGRQGVFDLGFEP